MKERLTKQGVRDLNPLPSPKRARLSRARYGPFRQCMHPRIRSSVHYVHGRPWGDMECGDCGLLFEAHNV